MTDRDAYCDVDRFRWPQDERAERGAEEVERRYTEGSRRGRPDNE